jgi:hypothetical protein
MKYPKSTAEKTGSPGGQQHEEINENQKNAFKNKDTSLLYKSENIGISVVTTTWNERENLRS